ncbi:MAG: hypothetical protein ACU84H_02555 [Gammaproteobacteria bacterium]
MKKSIFLAVMWLISGAAFAVTDHYVLRDGNHVQHLKITQLKNDIYVSVDVDFEANEDEAGKRSCSAEISGKAEFINENELFMKVHSQGQANYCKLNIKLSGDTATIDQSAHCDNFVRGICHFSTGGKELVKIK